MYLSIFHLHLLAHGPHILLWKLECRWRLYQTIWQKYQLHFHRAYGARRRCLAWKFNYTVQTQKMQIIFLSCFILEARELMDQGIPCGTYTSPTS